MAVKNSGSMTEKYDGDIVKQYTVFSQTIQTLSMLVITYPH